ncbi:MAG: AAC(3) family N-acetyltransferase [Candidatus Firestonebacteria bacterium]
MFAYNDLTKNLRNIGMKKGSIIIVHSSYKSIGDVEGRAETVVQALINTVGIEGTILMPTFTYNFWAEDGDVFDKENTPSKTGVITEVFRNFPQVERSNHPTHSVAVYGEYKESLIEAHNDSTALGKNSPFHLASKLGGYIILIGCSFTSCSLIHTAEILGNVFYKDIFYFPAAHKKSSPYAKVKKGNKIIKVLLQETPCCAESFYKLEPVALKENKLQYGKVGNAKTLIIKSDDLLNLAINKIKDEPEFLLCDKGKCGICDFRRRRR